MISHYIHTLHHPSSPEASRMMSHYIHTLHHPSSPEDDVEEQKAIDRFFSQKTILPSPWPVVQTKALPKRVTFSPLPPTMACEFKHGANEP